MLAALLMGGVVCTALSMAGSFITDLKIGYWLGTTPKKQETWKFLGTIISAATVAGVMIVLDKTYGFNSGKLAAPGKRNGSCYQTIDEWTRCASLTSLALVQLSHSSSTVARFLL